MKKDFIKKSLVFGIIILFFGSSIIPGINGEIRQTTIETDKNMNRITEPQRPFFCNPPLEEWNKTYGVANADDCGGCILQTADGGYVLLGYEFDANLFLIKTDSYGNVMWNRTIHDSCEEMDLVFPTVLQTNDGGYIILYSQFNTPEWRHKAVIRKFNGNGNEVWNRTYDNQSLVNGIFPKTIAPSADGGFLITGGGSTSVLLVIIIKIDANGIIMWDKSLASVGPYSSLDITSCQNTTDTGFIFGGYIVHLPSDAILLKTDSNCTPQWIMEYNSSRGQCVRQTSDGGYVLAGSSHDSLIWLLKTDANGNMSWNKTYDGMDDCNIFYSVRETSDFGYILTGYWNQSYCLVRTDFQGNIEWKIIFPCIEPFTQGVYLALQTNDHGYIGVGFVYEIENPFPWDAWVVKLAPDYANHSPNPPTITGPAKGKIKVETDYNFTTTDPNGDDVSYFIEWGDGTNSSWIGPYASGEQIIKSHTWTTKGTYTIKAKAKDSHGNESSWGTLSVTMPYSINIPFMQFWMRLFERFPNAFPILRQLMEY